MPQDDPDRIDVGGDTEKYLFAILLVAVLVYVTVAVCAVVLVSFL